VGLLGKVLLGLGVWYAMCSLLVPMHLVGPRRRETIDLDDVVAAAEKDSPEQYLAVRAQEAAQGNVRRAQRIANLQNAARNELIAAFAVLILWLLLGPTTGVLGRDEARSTQQPQPPGHTTTTRPTSPPMTTTHTSTTPATPATPKRSPPSRPRTTPNTGGAQAPGASG
jgi:hypothetical protein